MAMASTQASYVMVRTDLSMELVVSLVTGRLCSDIWIVPAFFIVRPGRAEDLAGAAAGGRMKNEFCSRRMFRRGTVVEGDGVGRGRDRPGRGREAGARGSLDAAAGARPRGKMKVSVLELDVAPLGKQQLGV